MTGEELHKKLKTIRLSGQKISLTNLAAQLGMSPQAFNSKLGAKSIEYKLIEQIAKALDIDKSELVNEDDVSYGSKPKSIEKNIQESIEIVDEILNPENAKSMTDEELQLFSEHKLVLLKLSKALAKRSKA